MEFRHYAPHGAGFVYLVHDRDADLYKVGGTMRPNDRLRQLAYGTVNELVLLWVIPTNDHERLEREWHEHYARRRVFSEWFRLSPDQVSHFKSVRSVCYRDADPDAVVPDWNPFDPPRHKMTRRTLSLPIRVGEPLPRVRVG